MYYAPFRYASRKRFAFNLHVLDLSHAFILSQDQTHLLSITLIEGVYVQSTMLIQRLFEDAQTKRSRVHSPSKSFLYFDVLCCTTTIEMDK